MEKPDTNRNNEDRAPISASVETVTPKEVSPSVTSLDATKKAFQLPSWLSRKALSDMMPVALTSFICLSTILYVCWWSLHVFTLHSSHSAAFLLNSSLVNHLDDNQSEAQKLAAYTIWDSVGILHLTVCVSVLFALLLVSWKALDQYPLWEKVALIVVFWIVIFLTNTVRLYSLNSDIGVSIRLFKNTLASDSVFFDKYCPHQYPTILKIFEGQESLSFVTIVFAILVALTSLLSPPKKVDETPRHVANQIKNLQSVLNLGSAALVFRHGRIEG